MAKLNDKHVSFLRHAKAHSTFPGELVSAKTRKARNEWLKKALKISELTD